MAHGTSESERDTRVLRRHKKVSQGNLVLMCLQSAEIVRGMQVRQARSRAGSGGRRDGEFCLPRLKLVAIHSGAATLPSSPITASWSAAVLEAVSPSTHIAVFASIYHSGLALSALFEHIFHAEAILIKHSGSVAVNNHIGILD